MCIMYRYISICKPVTIQTLEIPRVYNSRHLSVELQVLDLHVSSDTKIARQHPDSPFY